MGLFDSISNAIRSAMSSDENGPVADQFMGVLQQHGIGDFSGLVSQFEQSGLGAHVASWVGDGQNLPLSPEQVQAVLGSPVIQSVATKFGIDPAAASQMLSQRLPGILSHLAQQAPASNSTST